MLALCDGPVIEKNRWLLTHDGMTWEIEEFFGENAGLIVAEIELDNETQNFTRPDWVSKDVTEDPRYTNSNLPRLLFSEWDLN